MIRGYDIPCPLSAAPYALTTILCVPHISCLHLAVIIDAHPFFAFPAFPKRRELRWEVRRGEFETMRPRVGQLGQVGHNRDRRWGPRVLFTLGILTEEEDKQVHRSPSIVPLAS